MTETKNIQSLIKDALNHLDYVENCSGNEHPGQIGGLIIAIQDCLEAIKVLDQRTRQQEHCMTYERHLHSWERCDEYGWRQLHLFRYGDELRVFAYDKDGNEVEPNV
jgi:hypothetical protein